MTPAHVALREAVVLALLRTGRPVAAGDLCASLGLGADRVEALMEELEKRLFFLVRDRSGAVSWAFPVTPDRTPHRLTFSTGERISLSLDHELGWRLHESGREPVYFEPDVDWKDFHEPDILHRY